jgi:phosphate transport system protein
VDISKNQGILCQGGKKVKPINSYDRSLIAIDEKLLLMGEKVKKSLSRGIQTFFRQDAELANTVFKDDDDIDILDETIEMDALNIISLQQPEDQDLRFLAAAMRISRELERIGDYACDIAEAFLQMASKEPFFKPLDDLTTMADKAEILLERSLDAYFQKNMDAAATADQEDDKVDQIFLSLMRELKEFIQQSPRYIEQAGAIILAARYLERISDHAVNIAELTIFCRTGVRHPFKVECFRKNV